MSHAFFQAALERLVNSPEYRKAVSTDGARLQKDFQLSDDEMRTMIKVAENTGWVKSGTISPASAGPCCCCCCCPN